MRACPVCRTTFPDRDSHCARDGAELVDVPVVDPTASLGLGSPSPASLAVAPARPTVTAAEPRRSRRDSEERSPRRRSSSRGKGRSRSSRESERPRERKRSSRSSSPRDDYEPRRRSRSSRERDRERARRRHFSSARERVGATLGSYHLTGLLGQGGMGTVYRAEHTKLGREVALKLLREDYTKSREAVARFFREARAVNKIRHRNIVDITDLVELDDGTTFIIMELLHGRPLSKLLRAGRLSLLRGLRLLIQICDGLAAAHSEEIIHRDLKPDNIFVCTAADGSDEVKLLDFGVAKLLSDDPAQVRHRTAAGAVVGTPAFMSPEQAGSLRVDARSDIYSLGAIMYEMFTGRPPFRCSTFGEYVRMHLDEKPVPPSRTERARGIDPRLEAVILRCLEKKPANRFHSAAELRQALCDIMATTSGQELPVSDSGVTSYQPQTPRALSPDYYGGQHTPPHAHPRAESPRDWTPDGLSPAHPTPADGYPYTQQTHGSRAGWLAVFTLLIAAVAGSAVWVLTQTDIVSDYLKPNSVETAEPADSRPIFSAPAAKTTPE